MDDGDHTVMVTPIGDHDVEPDGDVPPTTLQVTLSDVTETAWTGVVRGSQPSPPAGRVQVQLTDETGTEYRAPADYDPAHTPHFTGVGPFESVVAE
jgi:hypothetical protein